MRLRPKVPTLELTSLGSKIIISTECHNVENSIVHAVLN